MTDNDEKQIASADQARSVHRKAADSRSEVGSVEAGCLDGDNSKAKNRAEPIPDEIWEHEQERLNPGQVEGNPTGASRDKPKAPSNSA
ncbi:hypothetical protein [Novosphingobium sp. JCM 18896]|uniref:hypothetical protein n=1 Tax=Novosphingobium sp. JCM 18896 TaxID=2989731 RepID=UPI002222CB04|nr:hypothetical protein [Novosphingobium sp. JCM 18896]MCW1432062.1 hypothetical protein [Novosphingobium sp. JCM 18896]